MGTILRLAPNTPSVLIGEDEVTISRLANFLDAAVIDFKIEDDGDLYASDGLNFPVWIQVDNDKKLISFFTFLAPEADQAGDWLARVNAMNETIVAVQFHWSGQAVWGHHWMSFDSGLNVRQFIKMLRRFSSAFKAGVMLEHHSEVAKVETILQQ